VGNAHRLSGVQGASDNFESNSSRALNRDPLEEIGRCGEAWKIAHLLGFTRGDLAVRLGV
jgi:hypothetical protein